MIINRNIKFKKSIQLIGLGTMIAGGIGLLWAVVYWRNDIQFTIGAILIHILCGAVLCLCIVSLLNILRIKINLTSFLGFLLGIFWVSPILLYNIDIHYMNLDVSTKGLIVTAILVSGASLFGLLGGHFIKQFSCLTRLFFALVFSLIVPIFFALMFPEIAIIDRLNEKRVKIQPQTRVMVLGIDGGAWDVIVPLLKQGRLPNLESLMRNGQYGILNSLEPSKSPVLWTSIFTGKLPENHGITDWELSDSRNRFSKSLWNILNEYGQKTITVNIPSTFPPERVVGIQISGFPFSESVQGQERGMLYSTESLELKFIPTIKIGIKPAEGWLSIPTSYSPIYESFLPSFTFDTLAKNYGLLRKIKYRAYNFDIENIFLRHFEVLGTFQEYLDKFGAFQAPQYAMLIVDTTNDSAVNYDALYIYKKKNDLKPVAVLKEGQWSDWVRLVTGRTETQFKFKLLNLSYDYLEIYTTPLFQSSFSPQTPFTYPQNFSSELSQEIGPYVVEGLGWQIFGDEIALDLLYEHLEDIGTQHVNASEYILKTISDWSLFVHIFTESDRVQHPYWKYFQPEYYQPVDENLARTHGGKINSIIEKIDAGIGRLLTYLDKNTTVIILSDHGFQANSSEGEHGEHSLEGIYIFWGKGIKKHHGPLSFHIKSFPKANLLEITPTILYLMGYPVGRDMDGKVMLNIIDDKKLENYQVKFIDSYESDFFKNGRVNHTIDESTRDQLRSLGYIK